MSASQESSTGTSPPAAGGDVDAAAGMESSLAELQDELASLRDQQHCFIQAEIQRLREMSVLNRMADALATHRDPQIIIHQACKEAIAATGAQQAWLIEPDSAGRASVIIDHQDNSIGFHSLPAEGRDLFDRVIAERPQASLMMPAYDPTAPEGVYLAAPLRTGQHLMGVMILFHSHPETAFDSEHLRLLNSVLHQSAAAAENGLLLRSISDMIVDVVISMAMAIESRDPYTGGHVLRVTAYALLLARRLGLNASDQDRLRLGGLLHDIGKIAVPDAILRKPGRLDNDEFKIMMTHAAVGHQIVSQIPQLLPAACVVRHHHERFDGKGYPDGLAGDAIDPLARITAVADTYDAMTSDRPYRKGLTRQVAFAELAKNAGSQFDPACVNRFVTFTQEDLDGAVAALQQWRSGEHRESVTTLLSWMDLNRPKTGARS